MSPLGFDMEKDGLNMIVLDFQASLSVENALEELKASSIGAWPTPGFIVLRYGKYAFISSLLNGIYTFPRLGTKSIILYVL